MNEQLPRHQLTDAEKLTGSSNEFTHGCHFVIPPSTSFNTIELLASMEAFLSRKNGGENQNFRSVKVEFRAILSYDSALSDVGLTAS